MASQKWNSKIQFPTDTCYVARICGATFGQSKGKDNPMLTLTWEVVTPQEVEVNGEMVSIAAVKATTYHNVSTFEDGEINKDKTAKNRKYLWNPGGAQPGLFDMAGATEEPDWENPDVDMLKGKAFMVKMGSDADEQHKTPTIKELEEAKKKGIHPSKAGAIMKHPVTGKPLIDYWPRVMEIFALAPEGSVSAPY